MRASSASLAGCPSSSPSAPRELRRRRRLRRGAIAGLVGLTARGDRARRRLPAGTQRRDPPGQRRDSRGSGRRARSRSSRSIRRASLRLALQAVDAFAGDDAATSGGPPRGRGRACGTQFGASRVRAVLKGHKAEVVSAHFDPTGRRVVTAGWDGTARVWDARTGASESGPARGQRAAAGECRLQSRREARRDGRPRQVPPACGTPRPETC